MRYIIKRISSRAIIRNSIHAHQLRHSYATNMINNGAPLEVIQSLLGHEKSETTKIYGQFSGKQRHECIVDISKVSCSRRTFFIGFRIELIVII